MPYNLKLAYTDPATLKDRVTRRKQTHRKNALAEAYAYLRGLGPSHIYNGYVDIIKAEDGIKAGTVYAKKRNGRTYIVYHTRTDLYYTVNRDGLIRKVA